MISTEMYLRNFFQFIVLVAVLVVLEGVIGAMVIMNKDSPTAVPVLSALMSDVSVHFKCSHGYRNTAMNVNARSFLEQN